VKRDVEPGLRGERARLARSHEPGDAASRMREIWPSGFRIRDVLSPPSLLSLARLPLALAFAFVVRRPVLACLVLALAGSSDVLDGWLARRTRRTTTAGAIVDPVADKVFVLVAAIALVRAGNLPTKRSLSCWRASSGRSRSSRGRSCVDTPGSRSFAPLGRTTSARPPRRSSSARSSRPSSASTGSNRCCGHAVSEE